MLRVHCFEETFVIKLRLEGTLSRDTYQQLESAIQAAMALLGARQLLIDVGSLTVGDESGVEVIRQLPTRGIELTAIPPAIESLFDTAAEQACREQCNRMQRLLFKLAHALRSGPAPLRDLICNLLRALLPATVVVRNLTGSGLCDS
jgi:anti-anti-sigma regulatory factor